MPGQLRPDPKLTKIAYAILKTEKNQRQKNTTIPTERQRREWSTTYMKSNIR
jgi:hypothetical protein